MFKPHRGRHFFIGDIFMIKKLILISVLSFFISACSSYTPDGVNNQYLKLSKNLDNLMSEEIKEKKRANLKRKFENFSTGMIKYKENNQGLDTQYLDYYIKETSIKIQYLKDLKD